MKVGCSVFGSSQRSCAKATKCMSCPVVQLCKGSCMFLEGEFFKQSCANEFAFNMGVMMAAVWHLTGMRVVGVEGIAGCGAADH
ncbi:hypothetical protein XMV209_002972 [Aliiroseovarius sp. xm-v-209]|nr:hypothetical protein [Aliiroseovarius sp. xm-m-314]NRP81346.1 hypothetical protein [Aliiroseovarius sp. xm-v-209]NRQ11768.1 hypothetical protein [Aliiroseovarius sp. xm-v-208]